MEMTHTWVSPTNDMMQLALLPTNNVPVVLELEPETVIVGAHN